MSDQSILLVGGPDSGKTNYLARLWLALNSRTGALMAPENPTDITYVEQTLAHLLAGKFAPRSEFTTDEGESFDVPVVSTTSSSDLFHIVVPDVMGEMWKRAVVTCELPTRWMQSLNTASGALLFVRVDSKSNKEPLDWVTAATLLRDPDAPEDSSENKKELTIPTQVSLCELFRFLELGLGTNDENTKPRVAVLVTAWDRLDKQTSDAGPSNFLLKRYPLFSGKLVDTGRLNVRVFGISVVGGDFTDEEFAEAYQNADANDMGYVIEEDERGVHKRTDMTLPVAWAVSR